MLYIPLNKQTLTRTLLGLTPLSCPFLLRFASPSVPENYEAPARQGQVVPEQGPEAWILSEQKTIVWPKLGNQADRHRGLTQIRSECTVLVLVDRVLLPLTRESREQVRRTSVSLGMGQKFSKEAVFVKDLKAFLRERGVRVKKKDLVKFFIFIIEVCPWFIIEGPDISPYIWEKVGRCLNDLLKERGSEAIPFQTLSYWTLIRDILKSSSGEKGKFISLAEDIIKPLSWQGSLSSINPREQTEINYREGSPCPSVTTDIPTSGSPGESMALYPPLLLPTEREDTPGLAFPVLQKPSFLPNELTPSEESNLEEEASWYRNPDMKGVL